MSIEIVTELRDLFRTRHRGVGSVADHGNGWYSFDCTRRSSFDVQIDLLRSGLREVEWVENGSRVLVKFKPSSFVETGRSALR